MHIQLTETPNYVYLSRSRQVSSYHVIKATIIKDLIMLKRYKANLAGQLIRTLMFILVFWFFAISIEFNTLAQNDTKATYLFYLGGFTLMMFDSVALWTPYQTVTRDLYNGTLESIYTNPSSRFAYFGGTIIAQAIISTAFFLPVYFAVLWIGNVELKFALMILLVILVAVLTLVAFGLIIGLMAIMWRQIGSIIGILGTLFTFLSGGLFPVQSFPLPLQWLAYLFPYTWGMDLVRYYAFSGNWKTIIPLQYEWIILVSMALVMFVISKLLLKKVEKYAKIKGLHLI